MKLLLLPVLISAFNHILINGFLKTSNPKLMTGFPGQGGVKDVDGILKQIEISHKLHHIKKVVLINHEDCGAYGAEGTSEKHAGDLKDIKQKILSQFPDLEVDLFYLHLDNTFEPIH